MVLKIIQWFAMIISSYQINLNLIVFMMNSQWKVTKTSIIKINKWINIKILRNNRYNNLSINQNLMRVKLVKLMKMLKEKICIQIKSLQIEIIMMKMIINLIIQIKNLAIWTNQITIKILLTNNQLNQLIVVNFNIQIGHFMKEIKVLNNTNPNHKFINTLLMNNQ